MVATVNAFLTVGFFVLLGQAHDELNREFIVATLQELRTVGFATQRAAG